MTEPAASAPELSGSGALVTDTRRATRGRRRRRVGRGAISPWVPLVWLAPALGLIVGIVLFPAVMLVQASRGQYSITGLRTGDAGLRNYEAVLTHPSLPGVLLNTLTWVVAVVGITIVLSLALAQFLVKEFPGRALVRWALIVPWAASLVITAQVFVLLYDYNYGLINAALVGLHLIGSPIDFLGDDRVIMGAMVAVGVFVSLPFTTFVFIAGLNAIPHELHEAARIDGASPPKAWWHVTLPMMRPALMIASVLNIIYVFNSFPIIYTLNDRNPGFGNDTTITFMYKLAFKSQEKDVGMAAATGILNVLLILVVVAIYMKVTNVRQETR